MKRTPTATDTSALYDRSRARTHTATTGTPVGTCRWHVVSWDLNGFTPLLDANGEPVTIVAPDLETARRYAVQRDLPPDVRVVSDAALRLDRDAHAFRRSGVLHRDRVQGTASFKPTGDTRSGKAHFAFASRQRRQR